MSFLYKYRAPLFWRKNGFEIIREKCYNYITALLNNNGDDTHEKNTVSLHHADT